MYEVVVSFRDLMNNNHVYQVGDTYPVSGYKPTKARIDALATGKNSYNTVFIKPRATEKE